VEEVGEVTEVGEAQEVREVEEVTGHFVAVTEVAKVKEEPRSMKNPS